MEVERETRIYGNYLQLIITKHKWEKDFNGFSKSEARCDIPRKICTPNKKIWERWQKTENVRFHKKQTRE